MLGGGVGGGVGWGEGPGDIDGKLAGEGPSEGVLERPPNGTGRNLLSCGGWWGLGGGGPRSLGESNGLSYQGAP